MSERLKPAVRADLEYHELDDGGVVCDPLADRIHTLNLTAAYVWSRLDGSRSIEQIATELHEITGVSIQTAVTDVGLAVERFQDEGLLQRP